MPARLHGGAWARRALRLAFLFIAWILVAGCRQAPTLLPARHYVRLNALLPLHPDWAQIVSLQREEAAFATAPAQAARLQWAAGPLPGPFTPPKTLPLNLIRERQARLREDTDRYIAQLGTYLHGRNEAQIAREERAGQKQVEAQVAQEAAAREEQLHAENALKAAAIERRIGRLGFRDVALRAQMRVLTDRPLVDARQQEQQVHNQIDSLTAQREALLTADVHSQVAREMQPRREQLRADLRARMQKQLDVLNTGMTERMQRVKARLEALARSVPSESNIAPPTGKAPLAPLTVTTWSSTAGAVQTAQAQVGTALAQKRADWQAQQARLMAVITKDTQEAVAQIARRQGWTLVPQGSPRATDATDSVAQALRAQWRQGPSL
ncbi:MAG TPA: hypothetical protein VFA07_14670 [Chthonomonadaceae bacterium]|nr:hypothetical protein [Chthonomonadaceae bacterium]